MLLKLLSTIISLHLLLLCNGYAENNFTNNSEIDAIFSEGQDPLSQKIQDLSKSSLAEIEATKKRGIRRNVIARIEDKEGNYIEWEASEFEGDDIDILISGHDSNPPIVDPDFVEEHSPLYVFLSVAPVDYEVPKDLIKYADKQDMEFYRNKNTRKLLHERHQQLHKDRFGTQSKISSFFEKLMSENLAHAAPGCTSAQVNFARDKYGKGYGDKRNCGEFHGFSERDWSTFYCQTGADNDCHYDIPLNECNPNAQTCSAFEGRLRVHQLRGTGGQGATFHYLKNGHRYRFMAYNCGSTGDNLTMWRRRGEGGGLNWIPTPLKPFHYAIRVGGSPDPRPSAFPTIFLSNGFWKQTKPMGGSTFKRNELLVTTNPGQSAIVCGDVIRRFETFDITPNGCNGGKDFCQPNQSCNNGCYK